MKIIIIFLILTILIFFTYYRKDKKEKKKYINKDKNKFYVSSKGKAYQYNSVIFSEFLTRLVPEKEIVHKNISNPNLLLLSHFEEFDGEKIYTDKDTKTISWSAEPFNVKNAKKYNIILDITTINIPFLVISYLQEKDAYSLDRLRNNNFKPINSRPFLLAYISTNCKRHRDKLFKLFSKYENCHSLGKCLNNRPKAPGGYTDLTKIYEDYKFAFAMENTKQEGYITEKILNIYHSGAIPIFYGDSELVSKIFNKETYIDVSDFNSYQDVVNHVLQLSKNPEKLEEMQTKNKIINEEFFTSKYHLDKIDIEDLRSKLNLL